MHCILVYVKSFIFKKYLLLIVAALLFVSMGRAIYAQTAPAKGNEKGDAAQCTRVNEEAVKLCAQEKAAKSKDPKNPYQGGKVKQKVTAEIDKDVADKKAGEKEEVEKETSCTADGKPSQGSKRYAVNWAVITKGKVGEAKFCQSEDELKSDYQGSLANCVKMCGDAGVGLHLPSEQASIIRQVAAVILAQQSPAADAKGKVCGKVGKYIAVCGKEKPKPGTYNDPSIVSTSSATDKGATGGASSTQAAQSPTSQSAGQPAVKEAKSLYSTGNTTASPVASSGTAPIATGSTNGTPASSAPTSGTSAPTASGGSTSGGTAGSSTAGGAPVSAPATAGGATGGATGGGTAGGASGGAPTGGAVGRGDTGGVASGPRGGGSIADSSRPSQMPTYTPQPQPTGTGAARGGSSLGAPNFFSQFLGGGTPAVSAPSNGAGYAQTYTAPTYASQAPTQAQLTQAQHAAPLTLPKTTLRTQQSSTSALDAIAALANDASTIEALLAQQDTTPTKTLAGDTSQDKLLALLSSSATPEELVALDKKKQAANDKELRDTITAIHKQSAQTSAEQKAPVEVAYVAPSDQVARTTSEQHSVQKLALSSTMVTAVQAGNSSIPTISVDAVRTDIMRRIAPMTSRLDSGVLTARERDQFAADLYSRVEWVETAAYGKQYEVSVVLTSLSKQLEHTALLFSQTASVEKVRAAVESIRSSLALLPVAAPATALTLADLPLTAGDWSLRHLSFYVSYTQALATKATSPRARALFLEANRLVSFDMSIGGVASSQRNVAADIDAARNKVTLGRSLERDALVQQKALAPQNTTPQSAGLWGGFKALFGF